jgi:type II secretory pathway pseudopilin PulG
LRRQAGYTLVVCAVTITVLSIAVATALPLWSAQIRRDREEELIFRGFQYAEAIRVFQKRYGRYPVRLEELIEVQPRCIRRLWKDPMTEEGEWALILEGGAGAQRPRRGRTPEGVPAPPEPPSELDPLPEDQEGQPEAPRAGPIVGVHSKSEKKSFHVLFGQEVPREWKFTADLLRAAGGAVSDPARVPSVPRAAWIGRPFREGVMLGQQVGMPSSPQATPPGEDK